MRTMQRNWQMPSLQWERKNLGRTSSYEMRMQGDSLGKRRSPACVPYSPYAYEFVKFFVVDIVAEFA